MGSSGGGSSKPPNQPTPAGQITGYGSASGFNPQFNSVLSDNMGWADVDEIDAANAGNAQRIAAAPPPSQQNMPPMNEAMLRQMLAQAMRPPPPTPQQQAAMRIGSRYGAQGTYGGMGGGASYTGSSPMRR